MRPLELRLAHFGPYRDEAVLNFEALDRLFLVCGPTGAGKTTLFDALTYALYERTPGTRGGLGDQLASHHAPEGSVPRVSLRFALGSQEWRVSRTLRHKVPKSKGEGMRDQEPIVVLERRSNEAWEAVPGKRSELNQRLEEMLGLSAEEFAKIVVLPQGDFQRFLEASSNERERMLQKLFPVEAYERLIEGIKARAKTVEEARRRWEDRWQELTARIGPTAQEVAVLEAEAAEAEAVARQAAQAEAQAAESLLLLKALWGDWNVLTVKRREREALEQRRAAIEADRERLEGGRRAQSLGAELDRQDQILAEGRALRTVQDQCRQDLARVESELAALADRAPQRSAGEARLASVLQERGVLEHQRSLWAETVSLQKAETEARLKETVAQAALDRAVLARQSAEAALPPPPPGPDWDEALAQLTAAREREVLARTAADAEARRREVEIQAEAAATAEEEALNALAAADREAALWAQIGEAVRAAVWASALVEGKPCPVCGSANHPHPAAFPDAAAEAPLRGQAALEAQAEARRALAVAQTRRADLAARLAALPPVAPTPVSGGDVAAAQRRVEELQLWTRARDAARRALDDATGSEAHAREAWQSAFRDREVWSTRRQALADTVPTDPTARLEALVQEEAALRRSLDEDRRRAETLTREEGELRTRVEEQEKRLAAQREEFARLKEGLDRALAALNWTLPAVRAARLPEAELKVLEASVAEFERNLHRLDGETSALEAKFAAGQPPPQEPAERALEDRRKEREAADALAREKSFALRDRERLEGELREVAAGKQALEADFQRLVPLAQALDGRNRLNLRLTTWVLVQALEQVAASATHRLAAMSGGRYALKVQTRGLDGRKDWGLDLAVIDGSTGRERAVGTLSGGEKFMTSISLALGLADVIQERAGGLKLEAIFIDEGFGTLDDQSLDRAMAILHDLGKNRSVGLISHVAELRQRIASRVEVVKGRNGSTLKLG